MRDQLNKAVINFKISPHLCLSQMPDGALDNDYLSFMSSSLASSIASGSSSSA